MIKASWTTLLTCGLLYSMAGLADDAQPPRPESALPPAEGSWLELILSESEYPPRWRLYYPAEATANSNDWTRPMAEFEFQDMDALSRVSELRGVSLLTLAEIGRARMYLGVNEDGLVGLHFNLFTHGELDRYLEVVRMPYLKEPGQDAE